MGTALETEGTGTAGAPVLRRRHIGEMFIGGLVNAEWRDELDDEGQPKIKYRDGAPVIDRNTGQPKAKQELVLTLLTYESDMIAALGGEEHQLERGTLVRHILSGGGAGQWINSLDAYKAANPGAILETGLMVAVNTTHAERYRFTPGQKPEMLGRIDTQEELTAHRAKGLNETIGLRGDLGVRKANTLEEEAFAAACEDAYQASKRPEPTPLETNGAAQAAVPASSMDGFF